MSINKTQDVIKFDDRNIPVLKQVLDDMCQQAVTVKYVTTTPTANTVMNNELVILDDGSTRRVYMKTGKGSLGYLTLTIV